jgi:basic membrane protein A and related proteins
LNKKLRVLSIIAASTLIAGVAVSPTAQAATKQKVCLALDTGGINDKSFNQLSFEGAKIAKTKGWASSAEYLPAGKSYDENVKKFVDKKCTLIIGIGYLVADAITASAKANPGIKYAIVDGSSGGSNLKGLNFNTNENSFLAGYMAAGYSKTGVVATYGGAPIPPVTIFMEGFAKGVEYYNDVKGKSVKVLGWDTKTQNGTFVGDFSNQVKAKELSVAFEAQKADIIFPVGGALVVGTVENSLKSKKSVALWVDADAKLAAPKYQSVVMISVLKGLSEGVQAVIKQAYDGKFTNAPYVGTLKNKGVGLSPLYGKFKTAIPASLQKEVNDLAKDIAGGWVPAK